MVFEQATKTLSRFWRNYRNTTMVAFGALFFSSAILVMNQMVRLLREKEINDVKIWVIAMERLSADVSLGGGVLNFNISEQQHIPFILTDDKLRVVQSHLIPHAILSHPDRLRDRIEKFSSQHKPISFNNIWSDDSYILFYGNSNLLLLLSIIPYIFVLVTIGYIGVCYAILRNGKRNEQDLVWVGLAKETAHQLGTPISSLIGWIEYLRELNVEPQTLDEMNRDLQRLMKVADRFSKIGADTQLMPTNVNELIVDVINYFRTRMPRSVKIEYHGLELTSARANVNVTLIEWVLENLIKNSLDAIKGEGNITVRLSVDEFNIYVDVCDTGRGIAKGQWTQIFYPGYTTKVRGWGLGLSLSRRIVCDYHNGQIAVLSSEPGRGTTIRVTLNRLFE